MSDILARRLTVRAAEVHARTYDRAFVQEMDDLMLAPPFGNGENEWHRFVDPDIQKIWHQLEKAVRLAVYLTALKAHHETTAKSVAPSAPPYHGVRG